MATSKIVLFGSVITNKLNLPKNFNESIPFVRFQDIDGLDNLERHDEENSVILDVAKKVTNTNNDINFTNEVQYTLSDTELVSNRLQLKTNYTTIPVNKYISDATTNENLFKDDLSNDGTVYNFTDSSGDYVFNSSSLYIPDDTIHFTGIAYQIIDIFIYMNSLPRAIFEHYDSGVGFTFGVDKSTNTLYMEADNGGGEKYLANGSTVLETGEWYHISVVSRDTGTFYLFVNGNEESLTVTTNTLSATYDFALTSIKSFIHQFDGHVRDFYYSENHTDITTLINFREISQEDVTITDPVSYWRANVIGATLTDSIGANDMTDFTHHRSELGILGKCLTNPTGDLQSSIVDTEIFNFADTDSFSYEFWIKTSTANAYKIFHKGNFHISLQNGKFFIHIGDDTIYKTFLSSIVITGSEWKHIVITHDPTNEIQIYIDSILDTNMTVSDTSYGNPAGDTNFTIGYVGSKWNYIDELAIYDYALTLGQVKFRYNTGTAIALTDFSTVGSYKYPLKDNYNDSYDNASSITTLVELIGEFIDNTLHIENISFSINISKTITYKSILSLDFWIKPVTYSNIFKIGNKIEMNINQDGRVVYTLTISETQKLTMYWTQILVTDNLYYIAWNFNSNELYINGYKQVILETTNTISDMYSFDINSITFDGNCYLDEVIMYTGRELALPYIEDRYNNGFSVNNVFLIDPACIAKWEFVDTSDSSGNNEYLDAITPVANGLFDTCVSIATPVNLKDGSSLHISHTDRFTFDVWIKPTTDTWTVILYYADYHFGGIFSITVGSSSITISIMGGSFGGFDNFYTELTWNKNEWNHLVVTSSISPITYTGIEVYINTQILEYNVESSVVFGDGVVTEFDYSNKVFHGLFSGGHGTAFVDHYKIYRGYMPVDRVQELYNDGAGLRLDISSTLEAHYQLDTTFADTSGNSVVAFIDDNYVFDTLKYTFYNTGVKIPHAATQIISNSAVTFETNVAIDKPNSYILQKMSPDDIGFEIYVNQVGKIIWIIQTSIASRYILETDDTGFDDNVTRKLFFIWDGTIATIYNGVAELPTTLTENTLSTNRPSNTSQLTLLNYSTGTQSDFYIYDNALDATDITFRVLGSFNPYYSLAGTAISTYNIIPNSLFNNLTDIIPIDEIIPPNTSIKYIFTINSTDYTWITDTWSADSTGNTSSELALADFSALREIFLAAVNPRKLEIKIMMTTTNQATTPKLDYFDVEYDTYQRCTDSEVDIDNIDENGYLASVRNISGAEIQNIKLTLVSL